MEDYTKLVTIYCEQASENRRMIEALLKRHKQELYIEFKRTERGYPNNPFDACERYLGRKLSHDEIESLAEILRNRCEPE